MQELHTTLPMLSILQRVMKALFKDPGPLSVPGRFIPYKDPNRGLLDAL